MLGMTLALRLAQAGHSVTLFEGRDHLGGLADAWQLGDITWDRHYHVTLLSDEYTRGILAELGLDREMEWVETKTGFYTDGQLHSMSNSWEFLTFPPLDLISKLRLGWTIFYGSKIRNWRRLEQIPVADWLRRWSGQRTCEKIWLPLLRSKLGENYRKTSAAFIWATIARLYAARRTGLKKEMFGYLPGGYARTLSAFEGLLRELGVDIRLGAPVETVRRGDGGVQVTTRSATDLFDRVVVTLPSSLVSDVCPDLTDDEKEAHRRIEYQGIVCASLVTGHRLADYYVTNITDGTMPFTGVIEMTALVEPSEFGGRHLIYLPRYLPARDPMYELSDEAVKDLFLSSLEQMYPHFRREHVEAFRVSRARSVMALSTLDYSAHLPPQQSSIAGVDIVNSAQIVNGTLNVNETVRLAEQAARRLITAATSQPLNSDHRYAAAVR